ncbi:hypothetical protein KF530_003348 [Salmonella enterica]|nr:hypothetical protein [Salmonella enterica]EAW1913632.1 hypothetical protein [Salmonella enterica subsp. enterica]ECS2969198.1 hypothetical protein [Salmonella enterica subsp. enterica serovar Bredeney]EGZ3905934.1 hypothetical protein [Salmonella enterica subsp. enterica serovar Lexington]EKQ4599594.1 hypothetical protein [Salmonella enterica subsp. enterica serovar Schwarzengrund]
MDESRKQFLEWWRHPEQEELRKSCAEGWGEKIWSASRSAIEIELLDINQYLAELENKTLSLAFRRLAEGVRAGDITTIRAAGIKVKE